MSAPELAYDDAVTALKRGAVPVAIPLEPVGVYLGFWRPGPRDLELLKSCDPDERIAFAIILTVDLRHRNGLPV